MTLAELAQTLSAVLDGDPATEVTGVAGIEAAGPGEITFVANPKYSALARTTHAAAILVEPEFPTVTTATLRIKNPYLAFARTIALFYQPPVYSPGIHPTAVIAPSATIGRNAHIGAYAVIAENVTIGDDAVLLPHTVIYPGAKIGNHFFAHAHAVVREYCQLGDHVRLQNGAIIGADGFGFAKLAEPTATGHWEKIVQSG
ncbi:MAG TPA: LpxD N-terminal domain-containing protein, partial [Acidobacteriaceae bacterium]